MTVIRELAAALAGVQLDDLLSVRLDDQGEIIAVVKPGPKLRFSAEQVAAAYAARRHGKQPHPARPKQVEEPTPDSSRFVPPTPAPPRRAKL